MKKLKRISFIAIITVMVLAISVSAMAGGNGPGGTTEDPATNEADQTFVGVTDPNSVNDVATIDAEGVLGNIELEKYTTGVDTGEGTENRRYVRDDEALDRISNSYEFVSEPDYYREHTEDQSNIYIPIIKDGESGYLIVPTAITLHESEITRAISTMRSPGFNWGPAYFVVTYPLFVEEYYGGNQVKPSKYRGGAQVIQSSSDSESSGRAVSLGAAGEVRIQKLSSGGGQYPHQFEIDLGLFPVGTPAPDGTQPMEHKYETVNCSIVVDSSYSYNFHNIAPINDKVQADNNSSFKPLKTRGDDAYGDDAYLYGMGLEDYRLVTSFDHESVIWRGTDRPNIIQGSSAIRSLIGSPKRSANGTTTQELLITMTIDTNNGDYTTSGIHTAAECVGKDITADHSALVINSSGTEQYRNYSESITIKTYRGDASKKSVGNMTIGDIRIVPSYIYGVSSNPIYTEASSGYEIPNGVVTFYPYIRMTYQGVGQYGSKNNVNVRSEQLSTMNPVDYVGAAWYNHNYDEDAASMRVCSNNWSTHYKAVNGEDGWQGNNQVLPGGNILGLRMTEDVYSFVQAETYNFFVPSSAASRFNSISGNYDLSAIQADHATYAAEVKQNIEGLRIVQWVSEDYEDEFAWDNGIEVAGPGASLSGLDGTNNRTASTDSKYYFKPNVTGTNPNDAGRGDVDTTDSRVTTRYYRVYSDIAGNIFFAVSDSASGIVSASGTKILDKKTTAANVNDSLSGEAKVFDSKTHAITNFVLSIERNTGNDSTAAWAADGKWYNEAFDGFYYVYQATTYKVGLNGPALRTAVLDPALCPPNKGMSDLFTSAYSSQFRMEYRSDAATADGKEVRYIGTYRGKEVLMRAMEWVFYSNKFYIPNVNVMDLRG